MSFTNLNPRTANTLFFYPLCNYSIYIAWIYISFSTLFPVLTIRHRIQRCFKCHFFIKVQKKRHILRALVAKRSDQKTIDYGIYSLLYKLCFCPYPHSHTDIFKWYFAPSRFGRTLSLWFPFCVIH